MPERRAQHPFRFVSCMELRQILGKRAMDTERLLELMEEVPGDSIYYHTHSYFLRHPSLPGYVMNDFATWALLHIQDRVLAERLAIINPFEFDDIELVRGQFVETLIEHLSRQPVVHRPISGEPFEFVRSHVIESDVGTTVWTLREFREALAGVDVGAVYNHVCESRFRKNRPAGDFALWIGSDDGLRQPELSRQVLTVPLLGLSLEGMRDRIVSLCDRVLSRHGHSAA